MRWLAAITPLWFKQLILAGVKRLGYEIHKRQDAEAAGPVWPAEYAYINAVDWRQKTVSALSAPLPPVPMPQSLTIHWVTLDFGLCSGGLMIICQLIHFLEKQGHRNTLYIFGETQYENGAQAKKVILENYCPIEAEVIVGIDDMPQSDVTVATAWKTAYPVIGHANTRKKFYLVQDFEPMFYAMGSDYVFAEQTYRFGFYGLALGPWVKKVVETYGMQATSFEFGIEHASFFPRKNIRRKKQTLVFYARFVTPRRAFELGLAALQLVLKQYPELEIIFHGWDTSSQPVPFAYTNAGILADEERARIYCEATVGLAFSLTNISIVPFEMMACKLPVIDLKGDNTLTFYGAGHERFIVLAEKNPHAIAAAIAMLLGDEEMRTRLAEAGCKQASEINWTNGARTVETAILNEMKQVWSTGAAS